MRLESLSSISRIDTSYRGILLVALPISLSTFVQFVVVFTDNYFLSLIGTTALNAAGNSGILYLSFTMFAVGLSSGLQILAARRKGEGNLPDAGALFINSLLLSVLLGLILFVLMLLISTGLLDGLIGDDAIRQAMSDFLNVRMLGFLFYPLVLMFIGFYAGIARTRILLYLTLVMALGNLLGDYLLIFGKFGFPKLGAVGAAWASLFAELLALISVVVYTLKVKFIAPFQLQKAMAELPLRFSRKILQVSLPLMAQQFLSVGTWTLFFFLVEKMGETPLFISHITRSLYFLAFVSILGFAQTTKTYVSTLIAERRQDELKPTLFKLVMLNISGVLLLTHGFLFYPQQLFGLFTSDPDAMAAGAKVLSIVFVAILIFAFSSIQLNVVEGAGRTRSALWIELCSIIIYLCSAYYLIIVSPRPIHQVWMLDILYFGLIGVLASIYLFRTPWKYTPL